MVLCSQMGPEVRCLIMLHESLELRHSSFVINWARSSKTNLSVGLMAYLYALILASLVLFRLPTAIMNAYITQVC